jgi:hypothetical protein
MVITGNQSGAWSLIPRYPAARRSRLPGNHDGETPGADGKRIGMKVSGEARTAVKDKLSESAWQVDRLAGRRYEAVLAVDG